MSRNHRILGIFLCEVSQELLPLAEKKGIAIQYKKKKIQAVFDYPWTLVALSNILENAIKYSKPNSMVKVSVMQYDMYARVDITDNGMGIDYTETEAIFKKFYTHKRGKRAGRSWNWSLSCETYYTRTMWIH